MVNTLLKSQGEKNLKISVDDAETIAALRDLLELINEASEFIQASKRPTLNMIIIIKSSLTKK